MKLITTFVIIGLSGLWAIGVTNLADNMSKNADNSKKKQKIKMSKTDIFLFLFIIIAVSSAVASTAFLRKTYFISDVEENQTADDSFVISSNLSSEKAETENISKAVKTTTTSVSKTTKPKTSVKSSVTVKYTDEAKISAVSFPIDVNIVTFNELLEIDGIGETLAQRIIDFRSDTGVIYNMDMLLQVNGIGESKLSVLKQYLFVASCDYRPIISSVSTDDITQNTVTTTETKMTPVKPERTRRKVNINTASAIEITDCLLIDEDLAEKIIKLRNQIQYFSNSLELLYIDGLSEKMYSELKDYIII